MDGMLRTCYARESWCPQPCVDGIRRSSEVLTWPLQQSRTAPLKTMSSRDSVEQQLHEGAESRGNDAPDALHVCEARLEQQYGDDQKAGHEEEEEEENQVRGSGLPCCAPLVEVMLRTWLWCVLLHRCALGDVAATGTCILWMLDLHGSTAAACRAFSMLVMLALDAMSFSFGR